MPTSRHEMDDFFNQMNQKSHPPSTHWFQCAHGLSDKDRKKFESLDQTASVILDLHGKTADEAYYSCIDLLHFAQKHHHRMIKIIHGIGSKTLQRELHQHLEITDGILLMTNKHNQKISRSCMWVWLKKSFDF